MQEGPYHCAVPHLCSPPSGLPPPNERYFRGEGMKGICNGCGKETTVSMCESHYDESGELVAPGGWLCGECHHGGPKGGTEDAKVETAVKAVYEGHEPDVHLD